MTTARRNPPMPAQQMRQHATDEPIDWPARFRAAADAAGNQADHAVWLSLRKAARALEDTPPPPHVVEAIGRALTGGTRAS